MCKQLTLIGPEDGDGGSLQSADSSMLLKARQSTPSPAVKGAVPFDLVTTIFVSTVS